MMKEKNGNKTQIILIYSSILVIISVLFLVYIYTASRQYAINLAEDHFSITGKTISQNITSDSELFKQTSDDFIQPDAFIETNSFIDIVLLDEQHYLLFTYENRQGLKVLEDYFQYINHEQDNYLFVSLDGNVAYAYKGLLDHSIYQYTEVNASRNAFIKLEESLSLNQTGTLNERVAGQYLSFTPIITTQLYLIQLDAFSYLGGIIMPIIIQVVVFLIILLVLHTIFIAIWTKKNQQNDLLSSSLKRNTHMMMAVLNKNGRIIKHNQSFRQKIMSHRKSNDIHDYLHREKVIDKSYKLYPTDEHLPVIFKTYETENETLIFAQELLSESSSYYKDLALKNSLTKLDNQTALIEDLINHIPKTKSGLIVLDIKDFRKFKRIAGYAKARYILKEFVHVLEEETKQYTHKIYNLENDVFLVWFKDLKDFKTLEQWAKNFLEKFSKPFLVGREFIKFDFKLGVIALTEEVKGKSAEEIIDALMATLDRAKKSNAYHYYLFSDDVLDYLTKQQMMERDLLKADVEKDFYVNLQPQFDLNENKLIGFEALLRWNHPLYSKESPLTYIEMAERNSMILDIGATVMEKVFKISKDKSFEGLRFSVNISPYQMMQRGFIDQILSISETYQVDKRNIAIEVTETTLAQSLKLMQDKLNELKRHGFEIHLDDFGTEYSSLSYLKNLPIDVIKIDKAFVNDIQISKDDCLLVESIIQMAHKLNLKTVVEGVESSEQVTLLRTMHADMLQGYYYSEPLSVEQALKFVKKHKNLK